MKNQFDLKSFLTANRETVLAKYEMLKSETFFNGTDLRTFGMMVVDMMIRNNIKSEKTAKANFAFFLSQVYMDCQHKGGDQYDAEVAYAKRFPRVNN